MDIMIKKAKEILENYLLTGNEFDELIQQIVERSAGAIEGICYQLTSFGGEEYQCLYGIEGDGEPKSKKNIKFDSGETVEIRMWYDQPAISETNIEDLFRLFLNETFCSMSSGLPQGEKTKILNKCNQTLSKWQGENKKVAVFMMDLDKFKEVNDRYDHGNGSMVIKEYANILRSIAGKQVILIHQSGDEFNMIMKYQSYTEILKLAHKLRYKVKEHNFIAAPEINLTMAMGVYLLYDEEIDFKEARSIAESTYYPKGKNEQKQRDSIRICQKNSAQQRKEESLRLAYSYITSNVFEEDIFYNIYIDYIANYVRESNINSEFEADLNSIIDWINPVWGRGIGCITQGREQCTTVNLSPEEIGLAIMHGLLRNRNLANTKLIIDFGKNPDKYLKIYNGDDCLYVLNQRIECVNEKFEIKVNGDAFKIDKNDISTKKVVLVQSGYNKEDIIEEVFDNIVRIDERPTTGGGLPDFWAAALCELISNMNNNENLSHIIIYGSTQHTKKICWFLSNIDKWGGKEDFRYRYIAKKTYKPVDQIIEFQKTFKDNIYIIENKQDLISKLYNIYKNTNDIDLNKVRNIKTAPKKFLDRKLAYDSIRLNIFDGCNVNSLSDAYPTILEILRNSDSDDRNFSIVDQAGRELLELMDFKVTLKTPKSEDLPDYYDEDMDELNTYYDQILSENNGLFRKRMEEHDQLNAMIKHVHSAIVNSKNRYATRRAILVVPNKVESADNYSPLGLISIWLAPRFRGDNVIIDFSYTWRTVEAIVGLPLSMYASIRFAEELLEMIKVNLEKDYDRKRIKIGKISYIAHSLHMFLDIEIMDIVKGIINEATL